MEWLHTPIMIINASLAMIDRLQAQETLQAITAYALGTGSVEESQAKRMRADLARRASGSAPSTRKQKMSTDELRAAGIAVHLVPKKAAHG